MCANDIDEDLDRLQLQMDKIFSNKDEDEKSRILLNNGFNSPKTKKASLKKKHSLNTIGKRPALLLKSKSIV